MTESKSPLQSVIGGVMDVVVHWDFSGMAEDKVPLQSVIGKVRVVVVVIWDFLAMAGD